MQIIQWVMSFLGALVILLHGLVAVCLLIPGPHPEDWFQKLADFLAKFSAK